MFLAACLLVFLTASTVITLLIHQSAEAARRAARLDPGARVRPPPPLPVQIFGGIVAGAMLTALFSAQVRGKERRDHFQELGAAGVSSLVCERDGKRLVISDPAEIARFFELVTASPTVSAHHSHPTGQVALALPDGTVYSLGRDSKQEGELWLNQVSPPPVWGDPNLYQLRSTELSSWFEGLEERLR